MKLNLYILAQDMNRAVAFYKKLFQLEPAMHTPEYSLFSLDGSLYGIMSAKSYPQPVVVGNNCIPNILVEDIEATYEHVKTTDAPYIMEAIMQNGPFRLFVCSDSEGNAIEFYAQS